MAVLLNLSILGFMVYVDEDNWPSLFLLFVDQAGLELKDSPDSASGVLGLKAHATTTQLQPILKGFFLFILFIYFN